MIVNMSGGATAKVWKQERLIAHLASMTNDVKLWTDIEGSAANPIATYTPDTNGDLWVDLTDYVRTYPSVTTFNFSFGVGSNWPLVVTIDGLINPASVLIPYHALKENGAMVIPPSRILWDGTQSDPTELEFYATAGTWSVTGNASLAIDQRSVGQISGAFTLENAEQHNKDYVPTKLRCGLEYAVVKWISFTGAERISWLQVVKSKIASANNYSLLPIDNEYIQIKGREDGFTLRIDGLNVYDLWYYADILTSSDVRVSFDGGTTFDRVEVDTKNITIPDGEAFDGVLEINVNWKKYDAVAL